MKFISFVRTLSAVTLATTAFGFQASAKATQKVFLDFDSRTDAEEYQYSAQERKSILDNVAKDYELFDFDFMLEAPNEGEFSTLFFNDGAPGGLAEKIDFRNLDKSDTAIININGLLDIPGVTPVGLSSLIVAHELGHIQGLRHGDSFAPTGSGLPSTGRPAPESYLPTYPGPAAANETTDSIMASPASVGATLAESNESSFLSARSAVKLSFNERGTVIKEEGGNNSAETAQFIDFASLDVPNTLLSGENADKVFGVEALTVVGNLESLGVIDFFSFDGKLGDLFNFEVMSGIFSSALNTTARTDIFGAEAFDLKEKTTDFLEVTTAAADRRIDPFDPQISIFDSLGNLVPYFSAAAFNDDEFETRDSILIDLTLPKDDVYTVAINAFADGSAGDYELFGYSFTSSAAKSTPEPGALLGLAGLGFLMAKAGRRSRYSES